MIQDGWRTALGIAPGRPRSFWPVPRQVDRGQTKVRVPVGLFNLSTQTGAYHSRRGRRPENASEGPVSLPEYAPSVKDDRSGWKGEPPHEEEKNALRRVPVFLCAPSGEAEQVAPTPIKRGVQGRSSGGKNHIPFGSLPRGCLIVRG